MFLRRKVSLETMIILVRPEEKMPRLNTQCFMHFSDHNAGRKKAIGVAAGRIVIEHL